MAKKITLPSKHPMYGLTLAELMGDATAHSQMEDAIQKAITAHDKAKNRVKSLYGRRVLSMIRTDMVRFEKVLRRWEKSIQEAT